MSLALNFELHERQSDALLSPATQLLYGGSAGGGKSHLSRCLSILWALEIPGIQIYFFRRLYDDLVKNHIEGPTGFRAMLAPWSNAKHPKSPLIGGRLADIVDGEVRFWNGSKIFLCHLQHQKDLTKYYGPEFHVLFLEEATQFTEFMIKFLMSRLRIPKSLKIPDKYLKPREQWRSDDPEYLFPRAVFTSNPGGVGHAYIKRCFLDGFKPYELHYAPKNEGGHLRQFIPAKVDDNPSINREEYKANLEGLPNSLRDALMNGNWNAVIGAFYPEISPTVHLIKPFKIPDHWTRLMSMDWGACGDGDPFAVTWWAISDGSLPLYPRDTAIMYKCWYGRGLPKITVHEVARGILSRELGEQKILDRVAGGDIMEQRGTGPSIFEMFREYGIHFRRADMRRVSGWQQMRDRLVGRDNVPRMYFFNQYAYEVETIQTLQHDLNDPNDAAQGDDHVADAVRYFCMMRPWVRVLHKSQDPWKNYNTPTLDQMWEKYEELHRD